MPIGAESELSGIVDLVKMRAYIYKDDLGKDIEETDIPEDLLKKAEEFRLQLVEARSGSG
jgi:elongation factor G